MTPPLLTRHTPPESEREKQEECETREKDQTVKLKSQTFRKEKRRGKKESYYGKSSSIRPTQSKKLEKGTRE